MNILSGGKLNPFQLPPKTEAAYKRAPSPHAAEAGSARPKTDTIEISGQKPAGVEKQLVSIKTRIVTEASSGADPQRLESLKKAVSEGSYHVPARELAQAVLGF